MVRPMSGQNRKFWCMICIFRHTIFTITFVHHAHPEVCRLVFSKLKKLRPPTLTMFLARESISCIFMTTKNDDYGVRKCKSLLKDTFTTNFVRCFKTCHTKSSFSCTISWEFSVILKNKFQNQNYYFDFKSVKMQPQFFPQTRFSTRKVYLTLAPACMILLLNTH